MTRRILVTIAAATALVLLALLVPLWILVREFAIDKAQNQVALEVQPLVALIGATPGQQQLQTLTTTVDNFNAGSPHPASVYFDKGETPVGSTAKADPLVLAMFELPQPHAVFVSVAGGRELLDPVGAANGSTYAVVRVLVPNSDLLAGVTRARLALIGLGLILLGLALLVGYQLARSFLTPIRALATAAESLATGDLSTHVTPAGPPEIRQVGELLNRLAARIGELLRGEREQVADIAHRLRTPVTALRLDADGLVDDQERERLTADVDEMARMVDAVIQEARRPVREGALPLCDAGVVVRERVGFWSVLAEDQVRYLHTDIPIGRWPVRIDAVDLGDAIDALLGNVFEHTPEGAGFAIRLSPAGSGWISVIIDDTGPGFPDEDVIDRGRSLAGSTGLGLDIARRTAESSGGRLRLSTSAANGGRVTLILGPPTTPESSDRTARHRQRGAPGRRAANR